MSFLMPASLAYFFIVFQNVWRDIGLPNRVRNKKFEIFLSTIQGLMVTKFHPFASFNPSMSSSEEGKRFFLTSQDFVVNVQIPPAKVPESFA